MWFLLGCQFSSLLHQEIWLRKNKVHCERSCLNSAGAAKQPLGQSCLEAGYLCSCVVAPKLINQPDTEQALPGATVVFLQLYHNDSQIRLNVYGYIQQIFRGRTNILSLVQFS